MLNKIFLMGRLARDPELRRTQTGTPVASFRLAVDRDFKDRNTGERATDWIDVVAWRQTAEFVSRYFTKGRMAVVEGRLQIRDWTDKDGNKRTTAEVVADQVYFGDSKRDGDGGGYGNSGYSSGGYSGGGYASSGGYSAPAAPAAPSGFGAPAGGDQFAELSVLSWLWNVITAPPAAASAARSAPSAWTRWSASTTRTPPSCAATPLSGARSCPGAPPAPAPCISVS